MSRQTRGRMPQNQYAQMMRKPAGKKGGGKLILWVILSLVMVGGLAVGGVFLVSAMNKVEFPYADIPGAMDDAALKTLARELNFGNETEVRIEVPKTLNQAIENLDFRPRETLLEKPDQLRKRVTAEWLFGRELNLEYTRTMARALGEAYHATSKHFTREYQNSLMRAFRRWGHADYVHLFLKEKSDDRLVPVMLELAEQYPTVNGTVIAASYIGGKYGDVVERIVTNSSEQNAKFLVPYYDSTDVAAADRVKRIFLAWNTDVEQTRLDYYVAKAAGGDIDAWKKVSSIPFREAAQPSVVEALRRFDRSKRHGIDSWLETCMIWGDKSMLTLVQSVYLDAHSMSKDRALRFMLRHPERSSVDLLVDDLLNSWASQSNIISQALFELEDAGIDIDYVERVHKPIVTRYNDFAMFQLPAMKSLLDRTHFDYNLLVDQCLLDLRSGKSGQAMSTLGKMKVIEDRREEVAEAIQDVIQSGDITAFRADNCFLHWATPKNSHIYDILNSDNFGGDNWKKALRIALKGENYLEKVVVPVARSMGDFFKGEQVIDVLVEEGAAVEDLMIFILKSDNGKEVIGACRVLQVIGTEKSLPGLEHLRKRARNYQNREVFDAVMQAGRFVTDRVEASKPPADEDAAEDEDKDKTDEDDADGR